MRRSFPLLLFLASCVHSTRFTGPSGEEMVDVRCNGALLSIGDCYNRAREECGGNFQVANQHEGVSYVAQVSATSANVTPVTTRQVTVVCQSWKNSSPASSTVATPTGPALGSAKGIAGACNSNADCVKGQHCYTGSGNSGLCMAD